MTQKEICLPEWRGKNEAGTGWYKASAFGPGLSVFYASTPSGPGEKETLVARLLEGLEPSTSAFAGPGSPSAFRVFKDRLGRPVLRQEGAADPPFVSFCRQGGRTWAAVSRKAKVGIDAASPEEFRGPYPFSRVFGGNEWTEASALCREDSMETAALLWSLKESAVKALGRGFHDLDPRDVMIAGPLQPAGAGWRFTVTAGSTYLRAWSSRKPGPWVSLALWEDQP